MQQAYNMVQLNFDDSVKLQVFFLWPLVSNSISNFHQMSDTCPCFCEDKCSMFSRMSSNMLVARDLIISYTAWYNKWKNQTITVHGLNKCIASAVYITWANRFHSFPPTCITLFSKLPVHSDSQFVSSENLSLEWITRLISWGETELVLVKGSRSHIHISWSHN